MQHYYQSNNLEIGIDEAGRGCLFGPVCVAGVILNDITDNPPPYPIKDSKKCSPKIRKILRKFIEENSIAYHVQLIDESVIDSINILQATLQGMTLCVDNISQKLSVDRVLVDGTHSPIFKGNDSHEIIPNVCIPGGDNKYINIAAASILAKEYHDEYILQLCMKYPILHNYNIHQNKGYGTKDHIESIKDFGPTKWHRKSFKPCQFNSVEK